MNKQHRRIPRITSGLGLANTRPLEKPVKSSTKRTPYFAEALKDYPVQ